MDPFTLAAGVGAVGQFIQGIMGFLGGGRQADALQNAATQRKMEGGVQVDESLIEGQKAIGQAGAAIGASGGGFVGSNIQALKQLSGQAMFNARTLAYKARTEANADLYQAGVARAQGTDALIGGVFGGASSIAGGMMQSAQFGQQQQALGILRGLGGDSPMDYMAAGG